MPTSAIDRRTQSCHIQRRFGRKQFLCHVMLCEKGPLRADNSNIRSSTGVGHVPRLCGIRTRLRCSNEQVYFKTRKDKACPLSLCNYTYAIAG